jgi:Flp pilus assembly protein TadG
VEGNLDMTNSSATGRRRRRQGGSSLVEAAFVYLPLFAIFFGTIDFSLAVFLKGTFQNAVREGVRYAITYQTGAGIGQDASIKQVVQDNAMGFLSGTGGLDMIKVRYFNPASSLSTEVTGVGSNAPGSVVEVAVEGYRWMWLAPVSGSIQDGHEFRSPGPLTINAYASDVMGGLPVSMMAPPSR